MCIFSFYVQGSPRFSCSENVLYKPLQNWERSSPQIRPCSGCKMGVKGRQKASREGLTSPPSPMHNSCPSHCGDPIWTLRLYGLKSFGELTSTSTCLCNSLMCRFIKLSLERFLKKYFTLSYGVKVKVGITVTFSLFSWEMYIWYCWLWISSLKCWAVRIIEYTLWFYDREINV